MKNSLISHGVKKLTRKDIKIEINYVDSLGNPLAQSVTLDGHYLDKLDMPWKTIPGYVLSSIQNFQQTFIPNSDGIFLIYSRQMAAPVVVYHRNTRGELISDPQYLTGELNKSYQAQPLADAQRYLINNPQNVQGHFSDHVQEYEFIYNTTPLNPQDIPDNLFVQVLTNAQVFDEPLAPAPLQKQLPYSTTWHVFEALAETYSNVVWYNLGGSIWIPSSENINVITIENYTTEQKMLNTPLAQNANNISFTYQVIDSMTINRIVTVNNNNITAWQTPYGEMINDRYKGVGSVYVNQLLQLDNQSVWAELSDGYYVESKYLNM
jgi:hypothetical protein